MKRGQRWALVLVALALGAWTCAQGEDVGAELGDVVRVPGLERPTATRYADPALYDLVDVRWADENDRPAALVLELAAVDETRPLLQPIVEAYLVDETAPVRTLLPGSNTTLPEERGWTVAVRVTSDGAWAWSPEGANVVARRLEATVDGRTIQLTWPVDLPTDGAWVALSGVFDPFSETGWRPFERTPSPWAFAAPQVDRPVVDVFPGGVEALERAWTTGLLPLGQRRAPIGFGSGWWWLMGIGLVLGVAGLVWRRQPIAGGSSPRTTAPAPVTVPTVPVLPVRDASNVVGPGTGVGPRRPDPRWTPLIDDAEAPSRPEATPVRAVREVRVEVAPFPQAPVASPDADPAPDEVAVDDTGEAEADGVAAAPCGRRGRRP